MYIGMVTLHSVTTSPAVKSDCACPHSWGLARYGVLGHGDEESSQVPRQIQGLLRQRVRLVSAGAFHAVAVTYHGKLWAWGR